MSFRCVFDPAQLQRLFPSLHHTSSERFIFRTLSENPPTINLTGVLSVAQVSGLVQILLQTDAAGVLPAELPSVLVDGNEHGRGHGHGNVNTYTHDDVERRRRRQRQEEEAVKGRPGNDSPPPTVAGRPPQRRLAISVCNNYLFVV